MSLMKCYWMLRNAKITAFTVSDLLSENRQIDIDLDIDLDIETIWFADIDQTKCIKRDNKSII